MSILYLYLFCTQYHLHYSYVIILYIHLCLLSICTQSMCIPATSLHSISINIIYLISYHSIYTSNAYFLTLFSFIIPFSFQSPKIYHYHTIYHHQTLTFALLINPISSPYTHITYYHSIQYTPIFICVYIAYNLFLYIMLHSIHLYTILPHIYTIIYILFPVSTYIPSIYAMYIHYLQHLPSLDHIHIISHVSILLYKIYTKTYRQFMSKLSLV